MKLTIAERIATLQVLPREADFVTLRVLRDLKAKLSFTDTEIKKFGVKTVPTSPTTSQIIWKPKYAKTETDVEVNDTAKSIIIEALKKLNDDKKLTEGTFSIYEKFVEGTGEKKGKKGKE